MNLTESQTPAAVNAHVDLRLAANMWPDLCGLSGKMVRAMLHMSESTNHLMIEAHK